MLKVKIGKMVRKSPSGHYAWYECFIDGKPFLVKKPIKDYLNQKKEGKE
jgi:hypothetical protein